MGKNTCTWVLIVSMLFQATFLVASAAPDYPPNEVRQTSCGILPDLMKRHLLFVDRVEHFRLLIQALRDCGAPLGELREPHWIEVRANLRDVLSLFEKMRHMSPRINEECPSFLFSVSGMGRSLETLSVEDRDFAESWLKLHRDSLVDKVSGERAPPKLAD
jgi:hypothetical protein